MNEKKKLDLILKYIGNEQLSEINAFASEVNKREFMDFSSLEEVRAFFTDYLADFYNNNSISDIDNIRAYTGIAFRRFNSVLRGTWNYDTNGLLTDDAKIEYLIPEEANDGIPLIDDNLSYSKVQNEYLINKGSLSKIVDIKISPDGNLAYIKTVLIPQKMWNIIYNKSDSLDSSKTI